MTYNMNPSFLARPRRLLLLRAYEMQMQISTEPSSKGIKEKGEKMWWNGKRIDS